MHESSPQRALQLQDDRGVVVPNANLSLAQCPPPLWDVNTRPSPLLGDDAAECVQVTISPPLQPNSAYKLVLPVGTRTNRLSGPLSTPLTVDLAGLQPFRFAFLSGSDAYAVQYTRVGLQLRLGLSPNSSVEQLGRAIRVQQVATLDAPLDDGSGDAGNPPQVVNPGSVPGKGSIDTPSKPATTCMSGAECFPVDASGRRRLLGVAKMPSTPSAADALAPYRNRSGTDIPFNITRLGPGLVQLTLPLEPLWVVSVSVRASDAVRDVFDQPLQASSGIFATAALDGFLVQPDTQPRGARVWDGGALNGPGALVLLDGSDDAWDGMWPVLMRRWQRAAKSWGSPVNEVAAWSIAVETQPQRQVLLGHLQSGGAVSYGKVRVCWWAHGWLSVPGEQFCELRTGVCVLRVPSCLNVSFFVCF